MNKFFLFFISISLSLVLYSCNTVDNEGPNELGGNTDIPIAQVGNTFWLSTNFNGTYYDLNETIEITKKDGGVVIIHLKATIPDDPNLKQFASYLPPYFFDENGNIDMEIKVKMTSEGIQDYLNKDQKPHTLVKYDCKVGDKYQLTNSDGTTITRTVTSKSDKEDFLHGSVKIKTIKIEQDSQDFGIPGIKKIIFKANHKFGLVWVSFEKEDGTSYSSHVFSSN
ncbi:MAG: hypothetical protein ABFD00_09485 [Chloroherpetonaceae bacterium]